jgi:hypothetical protein
MSVREQEQEATRKAAVVLRRIDRGSKGGATS